MIKPWTTVIPESWQRTMRDLRSAMLSLGIPSRCDVEQDVKEVGASKEMSVVVAVHDAPEMLFKCLSSLKMFATGAEVILVDDGSTMPETLAVIERFAKECRWKTVRHDQPQGHSRSCEAGALVSTRPYLCLLNSDTYVSPWSWAGAKEAFDADPKIGVTGPTTSYAATEQMMRRAELCRHYWSEAQICCFARQCVSGQPEGAWRDLPVAGGFAFFIRKQLWDFLGGFDLNLPDYGNESELCRRVTQAGYRIVWTPRSYIHHYGHQSYGKLGQGEILRKSLEARNYIDVIHG